jgi:hypothetical protein
MRHAVIAFALAFLAFPAGAGEPFLSGSELFAACAAGEKPFEAWTKKDRAALKLCRSFLWEAAKQRNYPDHVLDKDFYDPKMPLVGICPGNTFRDAFALTDPPMFASHWSDRGLSLLSNLSAAEAAERWLRDTHIACEEAAPGY